MLFFNHFDWTLKNVNQSGHTTHAKVGRVVAAGSLYSCAVGRSVRNYGASLSQDEPGLTKRERIKA